MPDSRPKGVVYAAAAALVFSTSPVLARVAVTELPEGLVAGGRLIIGGAVVLAVAVLRRESFQLKRNWRLITFSGACLSVHFLSYVAAIDRTSLAHAITLVYLSVPVIAVLSWLLFGEALSRLQWLGVGLALAGLVMLTGFEPMLSPGMLIGDAWAVVCAITFAFYSLAGRRRGADMGLLAYAGSVYLVAGAMALPFAAVAFVPGSVSGAAWASVVGSGLLPMAAGHTLYNAALRLTSATVVNLIAMQEVVFAVVLGAVLFSESPTPATLAGVALTLGGVAMVTGVGGRGATT